MKKMMVLFVFAIVAIGFVGCGGGQQSLQSTSEGDIPDWFLNSPNDPNSLFGQGTATSQDLQMAVDKATLSSRQKLAQQIETKISSLQKRFQEETGMGNDAQLLDQFTQATKSVVSQTMSGSKEKNKKVLKDGSMWRAYVLVEYPLGAAQDALRAQIKKNEQLYTKVRAAEVYKELDEAADKYDQQKSK